MNEFINDIRKLKNNLGDSAVILGHHYQREEIISVSDFIGDSYYLAKKSSEQKNAKYIVFCGVRFMAEAAAILCSPEQKVLHPESTAGCPLADMANLEEVSSAWEEIGTVCDISKVIPLTYINSSAQLKAFCGKNSGLVCTSSNAPRAFDYAFSKANKLFFFPDQHLGRNTAIDKGFSEKEIILWQNSMPLGGNTKEDLKNSKIILWDGHCHVHTFFTTDDIKDIRKKFEGVKVIVHPECPRDVLEASDEAGSTGFIVDYVSKAPKGSTIAIGTEINLVSRLAKSNKDKNIIELKRSMCPNMYKINLQNLLSTLKNIDTKEPVDLPLEIKKDAHIALKRMLEV